MPGPLRTLAFQLRTAQRVLRRSPPSLRALAQPLDDRMVFVVGCPRSGTTFLARSIGACPGFVDLGEVVALKAAAGELAALDPEEAAARLRRLLRVARRLGLVGGRRAVEQTPEAAFLVPAVVRAFPAGRVVHIVRDGRDVACSLLERGWLSAGRRGADDAFQSYGTRARFWVEAGRRREFEQASDVRRAAWAWRRYVEAVRAAPDGVHEVRYEQVASDPAAVAESLAAVLDAPLPPLARSLAAARTESVGRFRRELTPGQLAEVEEEAGDLLAALGYLQ